jgi:succinoglycan biosynthesis transport protein ExoP
VDLTGYADVFRRRWRILTLVILLSVGAALLITQLASKRYTSSIRLTVSGSSPSAVGEAATHRLALQRADLIAHLATTGTVVTAAQRTAGVDGSHVSVHASAGGSDPLLTIKVTADDPDAAQAVAKAYPLVLPGQLAKVNELPPISSGALLSIVTPAARPAHPSAPRPIRNVLIGLGAGVVLGLVAVGLRELQGRGIRDPDVIRQLAGVSLLGTVPREFDDERLVSASRPNSPRSHAYAAVLSGLAARHTLNSIVVTSTERGEGKSTMAANLALISGRAGKRVVVVDADVRRPAQAAIFNVPGETGLADVLAGRAALPDVLRAVPGEPVFVLAGGQKVPDGEEPLASTRMAELLRTLTAEFDAVIVDGPPALTGTDALRLGAFTDGILLVTRPRRTSEAGLRRVLAAVERGPAKLLGVVIDAARDLAAPEAAER